VVIFPLDTLGNPPSTLCLKKFNRKGRKVPRKDRKEENLLMATLIFSTESEFPIFYRLQTFRTFTFAKRS